MTAALKTGLIAQRILKEEGEAQITAMLVHNPARYFTGGQE